MKKSNTAGKDNDLLKLTAARTTVAAKPKAATNAQTPTVVSPWRFHRKPDTM